MDGTLFKAILLNLRQNQALMAVMLSKLFNSFKIQL